MSRKLIVLRASPACEGTAQAIRRAGGESLWVPIFELRPLAWEPPRAVEHDALVLTSANAVRLGGDGLDGLVDLPVYAVGAATARAAAERGFTAVAVGSGGAEDLAPALAAAGVTQALHLSGSHHRAVSGRVVRTLAVYENAAVAPRSGAAALEQLRGNVVLLSPRAGTWLRALLSRHGISPHSMDLAAISAAAAQAAGDGWRAIAVAAQPTDAALVTAATELARA